MIYDIVRNIGSEREVMYSFTDAEEAKTKMVYIWHELERLKCLKTPYPSPTRFEFYTTGSVGSYTIRMRKE